MEGPPALIDKNQIRGVERLGLGLKGGPRLRHIGAHLFGGPPRHFFRTTPRRHSSRSTELLLIACPVRC
jgi:hypothetical protein